MGGYYRNMSENHRSSKPDTPERDYKYDIHAIPVTLLSMYCDDDGSFIYDKNLEPYRDSGDSRKYSSIISAFLAGLPLPEPIIAHDNSKNYEIVHGGRTLATIMNYVGISGKHKLYDRTLHDTSLFPEGIKELKEQGQWDIWNIMGLKIPVQIFSHVDREQGRYFYQEDCKNI